MNNDRWTDQARCKGQTHMMFPGRGGDRSMSYALSLCARCPVIAECRTETKNERWGVWAGELRNGDPEYREMFA